jgi:hypothetical protein
MATAVTHGRKASRAVAIFFSVYPGLAAIGLATSKGGLSDRTTAIRCVIAMTLDFDMHN